MTEQLPGQTKENAAKSSTLEALGETLRQGAQQEAEELVQFELDVENLAAREAALLGAYIQDDADAARVYWQELKDEVLLLVENRAENWLSQGSNPTAIDWLRLDYCIHRDASQLLAGEVATEQALMCEDCGHRFEVVEATKLQPCQCCGSEVFSAQATPLQ